MALLPRAEKQVVIELEEGDVRISKVSHTQSGKARFDDIYDRPDPRAYYRELGEIGYELPGNAQPVFAALLAERRERIDEAHAVVTDLCCSYGINAALMNHDLEMDDLFEHYADPRLDGCTKEQLLAADSQFFEERRNEDRVTVIGVDIAANAVAYGVDAGLLDHGASVNLEEHAPGAALRRAVTDTDLVTITGGVGYITERTFERVLDATKTKPTPWVASFALRWVDYDPVANVLAANGLATERVEGELFRQRRFRDDEERDYTFSELRKRGIDPTGVEDDDHFYANLFVSRPVEEVRARPVAELLAGVR